jgi:glycosyltransferase involved in cell wall biosynthesis
MNSIDLSVIIATRNRATMLEQTLESLANQKSAGLQWEAIVVDNGSQDTTSAVLNRARSRLPLVTFAEPRLGKNVALNRALPLARGRLLVFTDDDVTADDHWLAELHQASVRWPNDAIFGGRIEPLLPEQTPGWMRPPGFRYSALSFSYYAPQDDEGPTHWSPYGPNLAIRREVFDKYRYCEHIGPAGTNYAMGSETELLVRLASQGYRYVYVPSASVGHHVAPRQTTLKWLYSRAYAFGRGLARLSPVEGQRRLSGVPLYVWRGLAGQLCLYLGATISGSSERRCLRGMRYQITRGLVAETRSLMRGSSQ